MINEQNVGLSELQRQVERLIDERETFFDFETLPKTLTKVDDKYYDGQPIQFLIEDSATFDKIADFTMTASMFREMSTQTRLRLQAGHHGEVFKNVFGDYQITILIQKAEV